MILASFILFLALFFLIGVSSTLKSKSTASDYYLASRSVPPVFVGLSAMSTNNSGYMFVAFMGYTYMVGLEVAWLLFGWIVGDFATSLFVHRKLRKITEEQGSLTFAQAIANWGKGNWQIVRLAIALTSLMFLSIYAAAQFNAGGKSLEALFDLPSIWGASLVAIMVAVYCISGGIRASLWTDVAQTLVMLVSMAVLSIAAISAAGGIDASYQALAAQGDFLDLFPYDTLPLKDSFLSFVGAPLFVFGWIVSGFCAAGQPHIMVRFMTMENSNQLVRVRVWYYGIYILFAIFAMVVGLMTRVHLPEIGTMDAELVLPTMAAKLLPEFMVGVMLAGIFAAIMSTADSLLLSCSSALTHDILPRKFETKKEMQLATLGITVFALAVAGYAIVFGGQSVFRLTQFAWAGMGSAFAPLLLLLSLRQELKQNVALTMMAAGLSAVIIWNQLGLPVNMFNDGVAGVGAAFLVWGAWRTWSSGRLFYSQKLVRQTT